MTRGLSPPPPPPPPNISEDLVKNGLEFARGLKYIHYHSIWRIRPSSNIKHLPPPLSVLSLGNIHRSGYHLKHVICTFNPFGLLLAHLDYLSNTTALLYNFFYLLYANIDSNSIWYTYRYTWYDRGYDVRYHGLGSCYIDQYMNGIYIWWNTWTKAR